MTENLVEVDCEVMKIMKESVVIYLSPLFHDNCC